MSATNEGPMCQQSIVSAELLGEVSLNLPKPNHNLKFFNAEGDEVATLDFNGPGLAFEGIADEAAIVFVNWIAQCFAGRLKEERNKAREECIKILEGAPEPDGIDLAERIRKEIER